VIRPEVVDMYLRSTFGPAGEELSALLIDGRPATEEERAVVASAVLPEVQAAVSLMRLSEEVAAAEAESARKAMALLHPHFDAGAENVGECLDRMTEAERAECIELLEAAGLFAGGTA
jgi:hypothetical protein